MTNEHVTVMYGDSILPANRRRVESVDKMDETLIELTFDSVTTDDFGSYEVVLNNGVGDDVTVNLNISEQSKWIMKLKECRRLFYLIIVIYVLAWFLLTCLCHQHLCCVAYRDRFVIQICGVGIVVVCRRLSSHFVFRTVSQKWLVRFKSNLAYGCNWSWGCAV